MPEKEYTVVPADTTNNYVTRMIYRPLDEGYRRLKQVYPVGNINKSSFIEDNVMYNPEDIKQMSGGAKYIDLSWLKYLLHMPQSESWNKSMDLMNSYYKFGGKLKRIK